MKNLKSETFCYTFKVSEPEISIQTKKKFLHSKLSKKDSEIKISDTFKIKDFEVFDAISLGIKIPNPSTSKKIEVFGNWGYSKSSIVKIKEKLLLFFLKKS